MQTLKPSLNASALGLDPRNVTRASATPLTVDMLEDTARADLKR
jgi:hypothetical protein